MHCDGLVILHVVDREKERQTTTTEKSSKIKKNKNQKREKTKTICDKQMNKINQLMSHANNENVIFIHY